MIGLVACTSWEQAAFESRNGNRDRCRQTINGSYLPNRLSNLFTKSRFDTKTAFPNGRRQAIKSWHSARRPTAGTFQNTSADTKRAARLARSIFASAAHCHESNSIQAQRCFLCRSPAACNSMGIRAAFFPRRPIRALEFFPAKPPLWHQQKGKTYIKQHVFLTTNYSICVTNKILCH